MTKKDLTMTKKELIKEIEKVSNILERINKKSVFLLNKYNISDSSIEQHEQRLEQYLKELNLAYDVYKILDID